MPYPKGGIQLNGRPLGYNPYAAMPSLHIAWATIVATTLILLSRNPLVRIFAVIYPVIMLLAIVVTANHYIMDGVGSLIVVALAAPLALAVGRFGMRALWS
jgi:membrane-associated phospholipid phosphatase